ncbi:hypothetical protein JG687_00018242 [Phytophthora cactorum]|uniref:Uncharacterized protein n=1 Tax=Phytophthora cactorum TaxID=29920 RepID=A0A8T1TPD2_9STRA|nr:hypothetical protein JG687_00018242 [Phytophthora cactorum]
MQRARRHAQKFRPAPLKPCTKLQEADSFCISCGCRNIVVFRQSSNHSNQRLIKCQNFNPNCGHEFARISRHWTRNELRMHSRTSMRNKNCNEHLHLVQKA